MTTHTIEKNGVTFVIKQQTDEFGRLEVTAQMGDQKAYGEIPGSVRGVYPRIDFLFSTRAQWLHAKADRRGWSVDDYEESKEELQARPTDHCEFKLSEEEVAFLNSWRELSKKALAKVKPLIDPSTVVARVVRMEPLSKAILTDELFTTWDAAFAHIRAFGVRLTPEHEAEIKLHPDTEFVNQELVVGDGSAYMGNVWYEIHRLNTN